MKMTDNKFLIAYRLYFNQYDNKYYSNGKFVGDKYFVKELSLGENITPEQLLAGTPFYVSEDMENTSSISDVRIISKNFLTYNKENTDKSVSLFLYDLTKNREMLVGNK